MQEIALRFYRRLLQMGIATSELWNNIGLCCFHASQVWPMRAGCVRGFVSVCCGVWTHFRTYIVVAVSLWYGSMT